MAGTATLRFDIVGNGKDAQRAANRTGAAYDRMGRRVYGAGTRAGKSQRKVSRLGAAFGTAAKRYGPLAAAAAGYGILKFGTASIKAASDVQQSFGAIDSVFGRNSAKVKRWANNAATQVGLAKSEYANLAVVLGSMLKNTGIEDYAGQTKRLVALGSDLAATFGGTTKQAVEALGATLRGEYDPIEQYGVSIKQSDINTRLAAKGLGKLTGKSLRQAQQTERLKLIYKQTTKAQGQFKRETGSLAHQQQVLGAKFENLKATLGEKLLPVATKVTKWLSETVSGTNRTGKVIRRLAQIYRAYVKPALAGFKDGLRIVRNGLDDATGSSRNTRRMFRRLGDIGQTVARIMGGRVGDAFRILGRVIVIQIGTIGAIIGAISRLVGWLRSAAGAVDALYDKLGALKTFGGLGGLVGGLLRSADPMQGLARAGGAGMVGAAGAAPQVSVTSTPQVTVLLDGRALDARFVRVFHDELDSVGVSIRRGR